MKKGCRDSLSAALLFERYDIVGGTSDDVTKSFQCKQGNVLVLFEGIERFVVDAVLQELVLRDIAFSHCLPQWAEINHAAYHLPQMLSIQL